MMTVEYRETKAIEKDNNNVLIFLKTNTYNIIKNYHDILFYHKEYQIIKLYHKYFAGKCMLIRNMKHIQ